MSSEALPLIVVVEDEEALARVLATHLEDAGMRTQICLRAAHALRFLQTNFANLVLLDLNLPDQSGFSLLSEFKSSGIQTPIIFLTGTSAEISKVKGLEMGADDYVTKPFSYPELIARIRAVLRRTDGGKDRNITPTTKTSDAPFVFYGATLFPERMEASFPDGETEKIGKKEFGIVHCLYSNPGTVITRKTLIHAVWGQHADVKSRSLDQYIVKVRELFRRHQIELHGFKTVHGVGYLNEPPRAP